MEKIQFSLNNDRTTSSNGEVIAYSWYPIGGLGQSPDIQVDWQSTKVKRGGSVLFENGARQTSEDGIQFFLKM